MGALAVIGLAIALAAGPASAGTVAYVVTSPTVPLPATIQVSVPQFDRGLGRLTNVAVKAWVYVSGTLSVENTATTPMSGSFCGSIWYPGAWANGLGGGLSLSQPWSGNETGACVPVLAPFDGVVDFAGPSGAVVAFGPDYGGGTEGSAFYAANPAGLAVLDAYSGYGSLPVSVQAGPNHGSLPSGAVQVTTNGYVRVRVEYTYTSYPAAFCQPNSFSWCPCGNAGNACPNSAATGGAVLAFAGAASLGGDTLVLSATGLPFGSAAMFFQGSSATFAGSDFGDGRMCVSGNIVRLGVKFATDGTLTLPQAGDPSLSTLGQLPGPGAFASYQVWYRDAAAFCTAATHNLSSGVVTTWAP